MPTLNDVAKVDHQEGEGYAQPMDSPDEHLDLLPRPQRKPLERPPQAYDDRVWSRRQRSKSQKQRRSTIRSPSSSRRRSQERGREQQKRRRSPSPSDSSSSSDTSDESRREGEHKS